jgi:hypothetical protein
MTATAPTSGQLWALYMGDFTGTFNTNGFALTLGYRITVSGTGTKTLTLGASTITCGSWDFSNAAIANLTFNANTSTIILTEASTCNLGGLTYNNFQASGHSTIPLIGASTFANLTLTGAASTTYVQLAANQIITNLLTMNGNAVNARLIVKSDTIGIARTFTAANVTGSHCDLEYITGAGASNWNLSAITGGSGDCGGNSGITFTTGTDQHWTNASGGNWSVASNWTSRTPLPQDNAILDKAFGTSQTVIADLPRLGKDIDFTGATWTTGLTFQMGNVGQETESYGSFTLILGLTTSGVNAHIFSGKGNHTINSFNISTARAYRFATSTGVYTLANDFTTSNGSFVIRQGTFCLGSYTLTLGSVQVTTVPSGQYGNTSAIGILDFGSGTIMAGAGGSFLNATGAGSIVAGTGTMKFTDTGGSTAAFTGGGATYNNIWFDRGASAGANVIGGSNTFNNFKDTGTASHQITFNSGTTTTISTFTMPNSASAVVTINSQNTGAHSLVATGSAGWISCDYLNIQHSIATPANMWFAGTHSTNNQATATAGSGWVFGVPGLVTVTDSITLSEAFSIWSPYLNYLIVAGGGQGGGTTTSGGTTVRYCGGGGAGGMKTGNIAYTVQAYSIIVGTGGTTGTVDGQNGADSSAMGITSTGGGGGGGITFNGASTYVVSNGKAGGSGGGAAYVPGTGAGSAGAGTGGQGSNGGSGSTTGGGGGGAATVGGNVGGNGNSSSISGAVVTYSGGGGPANAAGGSGGGAAGSLNATGNPGTNGLGSGGGGVQTTSGVYAGGAGGNGIVVLSAPIGSINASGGVHTTASGMDIWTFTSNDTFLIGGPTVLERLIISETVLVRIMGTTGASFLMQMI